MSTTITPLDGTLLKDGVTQQVLLLSAVDLFPLPNTQVQVNDKDGVALATALLVVTKLCRFSDLVQVDFDAQAHPALTDLDAAKAEVLRQFPAFDLNTKVTVMTVIPTLTGNI